LVHLVARGDADGAARAMNEVDGGRQDRRQAELEDGVGMPAAHLHELHRGGGQASDLLRELFGHVAAAELRHVFHGSPGASAASISSNNASVLWASSSSSFCSAKPTWSST